MKCRLCSGESADFGRLTMMRRIEVSYYHCPHCGYTQTEEPYWLEEAYSSALSTLDVGAVDRNKRFEAITQAVIQAFLNPDCRFVDYGGGHGLFVRLMRDRGFDFYWMDKYAENLFAKGFEHHATGALAEACTAFEVFEHLVHPLEEIATMLSISRNVIFSTMLMPAHLPKPGEWWYYVPETGQHVGFFSRKSLEWVAGKHGLHLATDGFGFHMLSEKPAHPLLFRALTKMKPAQLANVFRKRTSLTGADSHSLRERLYK
jgi:hypothetical protein